MTIELTNAAGAYTGTIRLGTKSFPLKAREQDGKLVGSFTSEGQDFDFTASLGGDTLSLSTGGATHELKRNRPNPLAQPKATNPLEIQKKNPLEDPQAKATSVGPAQPTQAMRFTRLGVKDPGINNIEAVSFLIPAGWKADGGMQWFPDYSILANLLMKVTDPQTGATIEFLPIQNFTWLTQMVVPMQPGTNYLGNILCQPIEDVPQFIQMFYVPTVLGQLRGARVGANEPLPKVAAETAKMYGGQSNVKAARVRYECQMNGRPWEQDIYVTLVFTNWHLGTLWSVTSAYAFSAPKEELDRLTPVMNTTIATLRLSPEWYGGYMYVQKLFNDRMNQGIRNARAISDTITRNSEEIRQMFADSYKQRQESQDRINKSFSEYIRGIETYSNPFEGRPVELPSGYNDVWVNSRGEYLLSNQAGLDPNVGDTIEWRRMEHPRR